MNKQEFQAKVRAVYPAHDIKFELTEISNSATIGNYVLKNMVNSDAIYLIGRDSYMFTRATTVEESVPYYVILEELCNRITGRTISRAVDVNSIRLARMTGDWDVVTASRLYSEAPEEYSLLLSLIQEHDKVGKDDLG